MNGGPLWIRGEESEKACDPIAQILPPRPMAPPILNCPCACDRELVDDTLLQSTLRKLHTLSAARGCGWLFALMAACSLVTRSARMKARLSPPRLVIADAQPHLDLRACLQSLFFEQHSAPALPFAPDTHADRRRGCRHLQSGWRSP